MNLNFFFEGRLKEDEAIALTRQLNKLFYHFDGFQKKSTTKLVNRANNLAGALKIENQFLKGKQVCGLVSKFLTWPMSEWK